MKRTHCSVVVAVVLLLLAGCRLSRKQVGCQTSSDCDSGNVCSGGACVSGPDAGGGCEQFPPAVCTQPLGATPPEGYQALEQRLPGRWLFCSGTPLSRSPTTLDPPNAVGFAVADDLSTWWFLVDDGAGHPVPMSAGFEHGGTVQLIVNGPGVSNFVQVNLLDESGGGFTLEPEFRDGPPRRMEINPGSSTIYVHDDTSCGDSIAGADMGGSSLDGGGAFGQSCDSNTLTATSCQAVDGVRCTVCNAALCVRPCHVGGSDCPSPQSCVAINGGYVVVLSGDCANYDGYCG